MHADIAELLQRIRTLEDELEQRLARQRAELMLTLHEKSVRFEERVREQHRRLRRGLVSYVLAARPLVVLTAPVIYAMIVPIALLDLTFTIYQHITTVRSLLEQNQLVVVEGWIGGVGCA